MTGYWDGAKALGRCVAADGGGLKVCLIVAQPLLRAQPADGVDGVCNHLRDDADADSRVEGHLRVSAGLNEHIGSQRTLGSALVGNNDQLDATFFDELQNLPFQIGEAAEGEPDQTVILRKVHEVLKHSVIRGRDMDDVRGAHAQKVRAQLRHAAAEAQTEHIAVAAGEDGLCNELEGIFAVLFEHRRYNLLIALHRIVLLWSIQLVRKETDDGARLISGEIRNLTLDNLMFHAAMDLAHPGDVIVIDAGAFENRAIFGELMATYCKSRGIRGIVCDGAIRDSSALSQMEDFPVYARAVTPNGPYKNGPGEINVPVVIGGKLVYPGDIVVGDEDGVLFIHPEQAQELAAATRAVEEKEAGIMRHILEDGTYNRPWVAEKLAEIGCTYL